ncbi:MAG: isoamylase early set domain-containing protein [Planctomycetota bacterium]|jgi:1,4-alpha-glucan branching enzyme
MVTITEKGVEFTFFCSQAKQVDLVGDFTDWQCGRLPMRRTADGGWQIRLDLPAGEFRFRYWADRQWFTDYAAFGIEPGDFGTDSVVRVPQVPLKVAESTDGSVFATRAPAVA